MSQDVLKDVQSKIMIKGSNIITNPFYVIEITAHDLNKGQIIEFNNQQYKITDCSFSKGCGRGNVHAHVSARNIITSELLEHIFIDKDIIRVIKS